MSAEKRQTDPPPPSPTLDPLIHEAARLKLMAALSVAESANFSYLLQLTGLTRGNLSTHMAKLVNGGYIEEHKEFVDRMPRTEYNLTSRGRSAYREYLKALRTLTNL